MTWSTVATSSSVAAYTWSAHALPVAVDPVLAHERLHAVDRGEVGRGVCAARRDGTFGSTVSCSALTFAVVSPVAAPATAPRSSTATRRPSCLSSSAVADPGDPAADHRDVDVEVVLERREGRRRRRGVEPEGVGRAHNRGMFADPVAARIVAFLEEVGIPVEQRDLDPGDCFLPGLTVASGRLLVDAARLEYPGDLLHEAAHLAVAPPAARPLMGGDVDVPGVDMKELEVAAICWSYAAVVELGLDPAVVFHSGGYRGKSEGLIRTYGLGVYPGAHLLQAAGMTSAGEFPRMARWVRSRELDAHRARERAADDLRVAAEAQRQRAVERLAVDELELVADRGSRARSR